MTSFTGHHQGFVARSTSLCEVVFCHHALTMQVASVPLGLVSTQTPLISCSALSTKLSFFATVVTIVYLTCNFARNVGEGGLGGGYA